MQETAEMPEMSQSEQSPIERMDSSESATEANPKPVLVSRGSGLIPGQEWSALTYDDVLRLLLEQNKTNVLIRTEKGKIGNYHARPTRNGKWAVGFTTPGLMRDEPAAFSLKPDPNMAVGQPYSNEHPEAGVITDIVSYDRFAQPAPAPQEQDAPNISDISVDFNEQQKGIR